MYSRSVPYIVLSLAVLPACSSKSSSRVGAVGGTGGQSDGGGGTAGQSGDASTVPSGTTVWVRSFGDSGDDIATDVAIDSDGNTILCGTFEGSLDFGISPPLGTTSTALFLAKLDPNGNALWTKMFEGFSFAHAQVAVNNKNEIVMVGSFNGSLDFGDGPLTSEQIDIFAVKYDPQGALVGKSRHFGSPANERVLGLDVTATNDIYLTGWYSSASGMSVDFGGGALPTPTESSELFVTKFDEDFDFRWSRGYLGSMTDLGETVVSNEAGPLVGGFFSGNSGFGKNAGSTNNGFVLSLGPDAPVSQNWVATYGNADEAQSAPRPVITSDGIVIAGEAFGRIMFTATDGVGTAGRVTPFVSRLNRDNGAYITPKSLGDWSDGEVRIAAGGGSDVFVGGWFQGSVVLGPEKFASTTRDVFVARLKPGGEAVWAKHLQGVVPDSGSGATELADLAAGPDSVVAAGSVTFSLTVAPGQTVTSNGGKDIFVIRYAP